MARSTRVRNPPKLLLTKQTFDVFILISVKWNLSSHILYFIYMQRLAIQFVEMHCTRTHIRVFLYTLYRVLKKFLSRWRIFGSRQRLNMPQAQVSPTGGILRFGWGGSSPWKFRNSRWQEMQYGHIFEGNEAFNCSKMQVF